MTDDSVTRALAAADAGYAGTKLRLAAGLMRKRATITSNPDVEGWYAHLRNDEAGMVRTRIDNHSWMVAETDWPGDAEHIASWHPAVALAVADWLEQHATQHGSNERDECRWVDCAALAVADAYLGASRSEAGL